MTTNAELKALCVARMDPWTQTTKEYLEYRRQITPARIIALVDEVEALKEIAKDGKVHVTVTGMTGTGKSAVMGEIEIALRALGIPIEYDRAFQAEKNGTHADWRTALDLYRPTVVLHEVNVPQPAKPTLATGEGE